MRKILLFVMVLVLALACTEKKTAPSLLDASAFKGEIDGQEVSLYTLRAGDIILQATNYGARVAAIWTPDRDGNYADIVLGRKSLDGYVNPQGERFLGACVGPVANRIKEASFTIDGETYHFPANDNDKNTLHGGYKGLDHVVWDVREVTDSTLTLSYLHADGQEGFPGNLLISMTYAVTSANEFRIDYSATTDKPAHVNITNHPFFNLKGEGEGTILGHEMYINASHFVPVDALGIPTGEVAPVVGTPMDFREVHAIGERIDADFDQLKNVRGYDHNWCLDRQGDGLELACTVYEPEQGRFLEVLTDQKGLQFYSGNFFDGTDSGKNGKPFLFRCSLALETQGWPDACNNPSFPSTLLRPGETYTQTCVYRFSAK